MIRVLTGIALLVTITAGSLLVYLHFPWVITIERAGEVKKDQEKVSATTPPEHTPASFGPVPHVVVQAMPVPDPTPAVEPTPAPLPKARPKAKKRSSAAKKLKSKWVEPVAKPFSLWDVFNVR